MSEGVIVGLLQDDKPKIKKTDWLYYYLFYPAFKLPLWFTPNHVSYLRIIMCIPIVELILYRYLQIAGILLILAALMDGLDGAMARIRNQVSAFGKILDPIADKVLSIAVFITFNSYISSRVYPWFTVPIVLIDTILLFVALNKSLIHDFLPHLSDKHWLRNWIDPQLILNAIKVDQTGANSWGKAKMVVQVVTLSAMLLFDPNANYFISHLLILPWQWTMFDIFQPLLAACVFLGGMSLWGHLKVVHFTK